MKGKYTMEENKNEWSPRVKYTMWIFMGVATLFIIIGVAKNNKKPVHYHMLEKIVIHEATCLEKGEYSEWCRTCDYSVIKTEKALGHSWGSQLVQIRPTCYEGGKATEKCSRCEKTREVALPAKHDYRNRVCRICGHLDPFPEVSIGMTKREVELKCGEPISIDTSTSSRGTTEIWWYKEGSKTISIWFNVEGLVDFINS